MDKNKQDKLEQYIIDNDMCCSFCIYKNGCSGGVSGGPNGPIYPFCSDHDIEDYIDFSKVEHYLEENKNEN